MSRPFMPFYDGDWMRDTAHLDDHQERAYFRLVMFYWARGSLPTDEKQLANICRMTVKKFQKNRAFLSDFFDDCWKHKRIEKELEKSRRFIEKQALNGAKPKAKHNPNASQTPSQNETRARVPQPQPQSEDKKAAAAMSESDEKALIDAAGFGSLPGLSKIAELIDEGVSLPDRILPIVAEVAAGLRRKGDKPESWLYFLPAIRDLTRQPRAAPAPVVVTGFYAKAETKQFEAWMDYYRTTKRKSCPRDDAGGWRFPTEWPANHAMARISESV